MRKKLKLKLASIFISCVSVVAKFILRHFSCLYVLSLFKLYFQQFKLYQLINLFFDVSVVVYVLSILKLYLIYRQKYVVRIRNRRLNLCYSIYMQSLGI